MGNRSRETPLTPDTAHWPPCRPSKATGKGHKPTSLAGVIKKKALTLDPNLTFHGGDTEIHSELDWNGPTHIHKSGKPTVLLKYEQVAFSAYFGHFTQHSKCTGLDQTLFKSTNMEPHRCVLEWSNLAHCPTDSGEGANLPDSSQDLQPNPKVLLWQRHLLRATTSNTQRADGKPSLGWQRSIDSARLVGQRWRIQFNFLKH